MPVPETAPAETDHVTAVFDVLLTWAEKLVVPPGAMVAVMGVIETVTPEVVATVTVADADFVVSAALVAFTVYIPAVLGAVYNPELETIPALADQVTAVFQLPETDAANWTCPPGITVGALGVTETVIE